MPIEFYVCMGILTAMSLLAVVCIVLILVKGFRKEPKKKKHLRLVK